MRNKTITAFLLIAMTTAIIFSGCGSKSENSSSSSGTESTSITVNNEIEGDLANIPVTDKEVSNEECVEVGEYKGLKLTEVSTDVTDEEVKEYALSLKDAVEVTDENKLVESGDFVNVDFVGKVDGKEFDGGNSKSYQLQIGSGTMIDGFEDGIIGMKKGEEKDLNLTFPDGYGGEDLSGKDVVFHVKVNSISTKEQPTEEETKEAKETLEEQNEQSVKDNLTNSAWEEIVNSSKIIQLRKSDVDKVAEVTKKEVEDYLEESENAMEWYLEESGQTEETYEQNIDTYARETVRDNMIVDIIAVKEGLSLEDKEQEEALEELAAKYGMDKELLIESYGEDVAQRLVLKNRVLEKVLEYADIEK